MSLTKQTVTDKIEIVGQYNHIQVREAIQVLEDGNVISQSYHRYVVAPGETSNDSKVQAIIAAVHTPDVIAAYQQHLQEQSEV
jgi:hypothetical protein